MKADSCTSRSWIHRKLPVLPIRIGRCLLTVICSLVFGEVRAYAAPNPETCVGPAITWSQLPISSAGHADQSRASSNKQGISAIALLQGRKNSAPAEPPLLAIRFSKPGLIAVYSISQSASQPELAELARIEVTDSEASTVDALALPKPVAEGVWYLWANPSVVTVRSADGRVSLEKTAVPIPGAVDPQLETSADELRRYPSGQVADAVLYSSSDRKILRLDPVTATLHEAGSVSPQLAAVDAWKFAALTDFDGDCRADLVWGAYPQAELCFARGNTSGEFDPCEELETIRYGPPSKPYRWASLVELRQPIRPESKCRTEKSAVWDAQIRFWGFLSKRPAKDSDGRAVDPPLRPRGTRVVEPTWFAELPSGIERSASIAWDYNFDDADDLLVLGRNARYLWSVLSYKTDPDKTVDGSGIEYVSMQDCSELPVAFSEPAVPAVTGDLDGDGKDELLLASAKTETLVLGKAQTDSAPLTDQLVTPEPGICIGYNPGTHQRWGRMSFEACPAGYAIVEVDDSGPGFLKDLRFAQISGACCPLPAADILVERHFYESYECPAGTIATGSAFTPEGASKFRCTEINSKRYQLGPKAKALYWGVGSSKNIGSSFISHDFLPAAIRYGAGRKRQRDWDTDGCIGEQPGSVVTARTGAECGFLFQQLQYTGAQGDPARGTPVEVLSGCKEVVHPMLPVASCAKDAPVHPSETTSP